MIRALLLVLVWLAASPAFAVMTTQYRITNNYTNTTAEDGPPWSNSADAACSRAATDYNTMIPGAAPWSVRSVTSTTCTLNWGSSGNFNSYSFNVRTVDIAPPNPCASTTPYSMNVTRGWSSDLSKTGGYATLDFNADGTPNGGVAAPYPTSGCSPQGCTVSVGAPGAAFRSLQPTNGGLYRVSQNFMVTNTGASCTPTNADKFWASPTQPAPPCSGTTGYVNGVKKCIPADLASRNSVAPTPIAPSAQTGNPTAGSPGTAADIPSVSNDPGGNAGGPPHPADGQTVTTNASGQTIVIAPQAPASSPASSTPMQIDETGTPTKVDYSGSNGALSKGFDDLGGMLGGIQNKGDKDTSFSMPSWFNAQACEPFDFGTLPLGGGVRMVVDACPALSPALGVINFLWVVAMFFIVLAMVGRVMGPGKGGD